jgi:hypothetical protein
VTRFKVAKHIINKNHFHKTLVNRLTSKHEATSSITAQRTMLKKANGFVSRYFMPILRTRRTRKAIEKNFSFFKLV